ncbi:MAG: hypothetical protein ACP5RQ_02110 [Candidatus Micrarchaeia archaeon]
MKKINILGILVIILSLILISTRIAAQYTGYTGLSCNNVGNNFILGEYCTSLPILLLAILINFLISALLFLMGSALKNERWRSMGVGELYEAIAGAMIVGLFLYIAWVFLEVVPFSLAPNVLSGSTNPIYFTLTSIAHIENSLESSFSQVYISYFNWMLILSYQNNIKVSSITVPINIGAIAFPLIITEVLPLYAIAQFLIDAMYILWAEYYLIVYASLAAIPVFIIPGVFLRAFFPTRPLGSMMIAIGMGFLLVMPTLFAFAFSAICAPSNGGSMSVTSCNIGTVLPSKAQGLFNNGISYYIAPFWIMVLFIPALIIALTYAFITTTANFLGQAASMGGRLRAFI